MPSQREIRRRVGAVRNIKQITRAMQFVAASKLKRAQESTLASRPYSDKVDEVISDIASVLGEKHHPLLARRPQGERLIVLITSERGLAGPLNSNIIRFASRTVTEHEGDLKLITVGRKGRDAMQRAHVPLLAHFNGFGDKPKFSDVAVIARLITDEYLALRTNRVDVMFTQFQSTLVQKPQIWQILPPVPSKPRRENVEEDDKLLFEPNPSAVLERMIPRYVAMRLYQAVLENTASEHSARMVAMKNATDNAEELMDDLTLSYNKVRQANITREMLEIASSQQKDSGEDVSSFVPTPAAAKLHAVVRTRYPLTPSQQADLLARAAKIAGGDVDVEVIIDPDAGAEPHLTIENARTRKLQVKGRTATPA